jgi:FtsP/CotA-like multicopper oxidase with cupredoxin domain
MGIYVYRRRSYLILGVITILGMIGPFVVTEKTNAISGGSPYELADVLDVDPDANVVETTITAQGAVVDIGNGVMANGLTFNGQIPGPLFRLQVGNRVKVHFINNAGHATGIHWHGIELHNASDGTPLTQNMVEPGDTFEYDFVVTRPGLFWYHPHHHSSTNQVFKGMYGPMIVTDPNEAELQADGILPSVADTIPMMLSDATICKAIGSNDTATYALTQPWLDGTVALSPQGSPSPETLCDTSPIDEDGVARGDFAAGDIPNIQTASPGVPVHEGQTVLTNGKNVGPRSGTIAGATPLDPAPAGIEAYDVQPGQGIRLQLMSAATTRFFRLRLTDGAGTLIPLVRVGGQAGLLDQAIIEGGIIEGGALDFDTKYTAGEILLDPGDRQDVVAAIPATATGVLTLWTLDFRRTGGGLEGWANIPTVPVAHFNVTGSTVSPAYTIDSTTPLRLHTGDPVEVLGPATGSLLDPLTFTPPKDGMTNPDIVLSNLVAGKLGINGITGEHDSDEDFTLIPQPLSTRYGNLGDTLELTTTNATLAHHPFHLHGFSIQPLTLTKAGGATYTFPRAEYRDNIDVPREYTLTYRVRLDDRNKPDGSTGGAIGRWVLHCHIFFHAVFGMISEFDVVALPKVTVDDAAGDEGAAIPIHATALDPQGGAVTTLWSVTAGADVDPGGMCVIADPTLLDTTVTCNDNGTFTLTLTATNSIGSASADGTLAVANVPPTLTITAPVAWEVSGINTPIAFSALITDPGANDTLTCTFDWDNADADTVVAAVAGACNTLKAFATAGVYTVNVTGNDDDGGADSETVVVVVVDPDAGYVTGGGTINSPAGAYTPDPTLTGHANFGFVSKYPKGAIATTPPKGQTQFRFQAGNLNFHSDSYEWMVVAGGKAMYRGVGTINGSGSYGFLIVAYDGQGPGGGGVDKFRIKIWDTNLGNAVIYDNRIGLSEDIDAADPQVLASGSIVIHKK